MQPIRTLIFLILLNSFNVKSQGIFDSGEVPFEMVKNTIVIPVTINGTVVRFVLDTGGVLMISKGLQQQMQFEKTDEIVVSDVNRKQRVFERVLVDEILFGDLKFSRKEAIVSFDNEMYPNSCFGTEGMIGRDFFEGKLLYFDHLRKVIRLTNQESALDLKEEFKTRLQLSDRGLPEVEMNVDGQKEFIEFDSGSGDFFSYKSKDAKRLKQKSRKEKLEFKGIFSFGVSNKSIKSVTRYKVRLDSLKLGNTWFYDFYSDFSKPSAPRIGASILYYGKVIVDYKNLGFYFEPYADKNPIPELTSFGFDIAYLNKEYLIKWVLKRSPAEKKGLKYGLKIITINGKPFDQINNHCIGYLSGYEFQEEDAITLEFVDKKGDKEKITLNRIDFK